MSNTTVILGNLSRAPELKTIGNDAVLKLGLADNVGWGDKQTTNWFNVDYWGRKRAESLVNILQKGAMIQVTGELTIRAWVDAQGVEKFSNDIRADKITLLPKSGQSSGHVQPVSSQVGGVADDMPF